MNNEGILRNIADADRVAPFQPWAKAVYEYRQRNSLKTTFSALSSAGRTADVSNAARVSVHRTTRTGADSGAAGGGDRNWRAIYTDGRKQGQADETVRTYYGNSVGHWEKDTLVVDSIGFNEKFWFANGGLPHTEALHLTERFSQTGPEYVEV